MTRGARRALIWGGTTLFCAVAFYLAATRRLEFALANVVRYGLRHLPPSGQEAMHVLFAHLPVDEDPSAWLVRKAASVVFFGAIGCVACVAARRRVRPGLPAALLALGASVGMSAAIEVYEWPEPAADIAFDLVCGALGGLLVLLVLRFVIFRAPARKP